MSEPITDRTFAELFMQSVDRPMAYHVYQLFHDWWAEAPQDAIDQYLDDLRSVPGAKEFLAERHMPPTLQLSDLADCAPGTLGDAYRSFVIDNNLEVNLAKNYHDFNAQLSADGTLDRMPPDICYTIVRGFMLHDFMHVITGHAPDIPGELGMATFHYAQLRFPYHAMRVAVVAGHIAYVSPKDIIPAMDAFTNGWMMGRTWKNLHFVKWEEQLHRPLDEIRAEYGADALV